MEEIHVLALTHKILSLDVIGKYTLHDGKRQDVLCAIKDYFGFKELMYIATCNRVEVIFITEKTWDLEQTGKLLQVIHPDSTPSIEWLADIEFFTGAFAVNHLLRVISSLESMAVGEREIITQFRKSYESCRAWNLTGDHMRLLVNQCVKTAKNVHSKTQLNGKPVSIASFAWKNIKEFAPSADSRIVLIGAGQMMRVICKYLKENDYSRVTMYNRTPETAKNLMVPMKGSWGSLLDMQEHVDGCDVLLVCTSANQVIVGQKQFQQIFSDAGKKLIIDLSVPSNVSPELRDTANTKLLDMEAIGNRIVANQIFWQEAVKKCEPIIEESLKEFVVIHQQRKIERMMHQVPCTIKKIRTTAICEVFANEVNDLDAKAKETLVNIMDYMEKKYISVPMKMARELLLKASENR